MPKRILIVDDEPDVLMLLGERLTKAGYLIVKASSGDEAIKKAKEDSPDLVILDVAMPGMDGSEAASILRADSKTKDIPILFLTCLFTKHEEQACGHLFGQNYFIAKPYDVSELLREVEKRISGGVKKDDNDK